MKIYSYQGRANIIGERLRIARERRELSQDAVAARMQVEGVSLSQKAISRIEKGERFVADYELLIFSQILSVNTNWLLTGEGDSRPQSSDS